METHSAIIRNNGLIITQFRHVLPPARVPAPASASNAEQKALQPSPAMRFPSSQISPASSTPLPQRVAGRRATAGACRSRRSPRRRGRRPRRPAGRGAAAAGASFSSTAEEERHICARGRRADMSLRLLSFASPSVKTQHTMETFAELWRAAV